MIHWILIVYAVVSAAVGYFLARRTVLPRSAGWSEAIRIAFACATPCVVPALLVYLTSRAVTSPFRKTPHERLDLPAVRPPAEPRVQPDQP